MKTRLSIAVAVLVLAVMSGLASYAVFAPKSADAQGYYCYNSGWPIEQTCVFVPTWPNVYW